MGLFSFAELWRIYYNSNMFNYAKRHIAKAIVFCLIGCFFTEACSFASKKCDNCRREETSRIFYFKYGSSALDVATKESVKTLAQDLSCYKGDIRLEGHTDAVSGTEFNKKLGMRRAKAVEDFLISLGIEPSRIKTITYGKEKPLVQGSGPEANALNRCVVVVFEGVSE